MCRLLLADTSLQVRLKGQLSKPFQTTIGTPQGDGLSPVLFAVYLERALREVRTAAPPLPKEDTGLPREAIYADDTDFFSTDINYLKQLEANIPPTIGAYNLAANANKWERTTLSNASAEWKGVRKLGSLLGVEEDIDKRIGLASAQFNALEKLWARPHRINLSSRLRAFNALVLPVLLYNASTWGVCQLAVNKLEVFHRRLLRRVFGIRWPYTVSNEQIYRLCNSEPLGSTLMRLRWNLFGHVLRLSVDTPAQIAMSYYCNVPVGAVVERGRPQVTLPVLLFSEFHAYKQHLKPSTYHQKPSTALRELRKLASDRPTWVKLTEHVCGANKAFTPVDTP